MTETKQDDRSCIRGLLASAQYREEEAVSLPEDIKTGDQFIAWVRSGMNEENNNEK